MRRDEEEGGTKRKEGRGGIRDEESEKMKKLLKKMKNEKVAKGRIIGLAGLCFGFIPSPDGLFPCCLPIVVCVDKIEKREREPAMNQ